jgi:ATP/maltotriose-dependent transcriptional regulator MalT
VLLGYLVVVELAEAAARTGEMTLVQAALDWLSERTRVTPTEWVLGIEARVRALLSDGEAADRWYRESIQRLGRTPIRAELARSHLLYGEWLRRTTGTSDGLTAQEAQVARLARDGLSNPEIGARLFISPRTAAYHLSSVFTKLGISYRSQLYRVLPSDPGAVRLR